MAKSTRQRDAKGRFLRGCPPGPGRPCAPKEEQYLQILRETIDLSQWQKVIRAVLEKAQSGDLRAFEALARHIMPLPAQRLKISEEPADEYRVAGLAPDQLDEAMMNRLFQKIAERRQYEVGIRQHQQDAGNGAGVPRIADQSNPGTRRSGRQA